MFNVYNIDIQRINSINDLPSTNFSVIESKVNRMVLEILIQYNSQGNPEVQALWDEKSAKLYLVGGKIDSPVVNETQDSVCVTLAKTNKARLSIDLSSLGKNREVKIFKMNPASFVREEITPHRPIMVRDAHEDLLMTVTLKN